MGHHLRSLKSYKNGVGFGAYLVRSLVFLVIAWLATASIKEANLYSHHEMLTRDFILQCYFGIKIKTNQHEPSSKKRHLICEVGSFGACLLVIITQLHAANH